ncbi:MAG: hypothetical protein J6V90_00085 [Treponema sp.]|nr:hypothetical protein [Treponema sp.]
MAVLIIKSRLCRASALAAKSLSNWAARFFSFAVKGLVCTFSAVSVISPVIVLIFSIFLQIGFGSCLELKFYVKGRRRGSENCAAALFFTSLGGQ